MLDREMLVERVRGIIAEAALCSNDECLSCIQAARAAIAVIEPAVREDEMDRCAKVLNGYGISGIIRGGSNGG